MTKLICTVKPNRYALSDIYHCSVRFSRADFSRVVLEWTSPAGLLNTSCEKGDKALLSLLAHKFGGTVRRLVSFIDTVTF